MKTVVSRDTIYVGHVVKPLQFFKALQDGIDGDGYSIRTGQLRVNKSHIVRSMLFTITEDGLANDLLYKSPLYPILNKASIKDCQASDLVVEHPVRISGLLSRNNFGKFLTFKDLKLVRKNIFSAGYLIKNSERFGMLQVLAPSGVEDEPNFDIEVKGFTREVFPTVKYYYAAGATFIRSDEAEIPQQYWKVLSDHITDVPGMLTTDCFTPSSYDEGKIVKRLKLK